MQGSDAVWRRDLGFERLRGEEMSVASGVPA